MREILFRGKRLDDGEWVYGSYVEQYGATEIYLPDGVDRECGFDHYHILPESLGQYTGLNDKNGTKIFEGDVVKYHYLDGFSVREVIFDQCTAEFRLRDIYGCHKIYFPLLCEVLGNVHDNPELFKGGSSELKGGED